MAEPPLLALSGIRYHLGDQTILDGVELAIAPGERLSLVGRNGAGKSTLLRILAGEPIADSGTRFAQPGATIASLPQEPDFSGHASVAHYVASALADALGPSDYRVAALLAEMKLDGARDPSGLSGGEARRAALARALVGRARRAAARRAHQPSRPADHRMAGGEASAWKGAYVLVSHDRRFLANLSRAVLWLDRGIVRRLDKGYAAFDDWSNEILEREATERHKLDRLIERETEWAGKSIRARRTRNEGRLRQLNDLRKQRRQQIGPVGRATIEAGSAEQSGALAITARNISKRWGERVIVENFSTRIFRKDRIGLIGPNGAGKTTLLQHADRRAFARQRLGEARRQPGAGGDRPAPRRPRSRQDAVGDSGRPQRPSAGARPADARHELPARIPVPRRAGAPARAHPVGRRAQPPAARQGAGRAVQPAGARRADQRPRRRHARSAAGGARRTTTAPSCW